MNELALFAGAGGGILGGKLLGWRTVCAVECEPYAAAVLCARQNDGLLPPFPVWDDVRTFDGKPWRGLVDVVSGGFPCQDISAAGKGAGITGERSGLWREMARIIGEVRPRFAFVENSPALTRRGLGVVLGDLAELGYDARWGVLGAVDAGAPHKRNRIWIVANAMHEWHGWREQQPQGSEGANDVADARHLCGRDWPKSGQAKSTSTTGCSKILGNSKCARLERANNFCGASESKQKPKKISSTSAPDFSGIPRAAWWATEPDLGRVAHGVAARVDRLKAIGNGQVPAVAALAWETLKP